MITFEKELRDWITAQFLYTSPGDGHSPTEEQIKEHVDHQVSMLVRELFRDYLAPREEEG